ncbi:nucleotide sugar dehydrogenase [Sporomusa sp. KB1]|jgi:UDP-N-acetyl-D-glucosamine dehydrogenase|uniref:nucleotide sugar dehydrogenase n=1 Tax=Sporomusa sp. KB1 TaxID=943346 RepID=UPI0011A8149B|nr:nucleotide sugar dehydrogenase [Sporomusa sp. KB1]TWH45231.1 UDP-N-acetyl-D-glucosamine dehydrogenase [Sporomusa sp. KB1]
MKQVLLDKIKSRQAVLGVVGLGYVGLPLAVEKAKAGYKTIGFDIQTQKVAMVNAGENYIGDIVPEDLKDVVNSGKLKATVNYSLIKDVDCVAICVPTPLDQYQQPDVSYVVNSSKEIAKYLHPGMLVILESTTYPGTTEEVVKPILEETGLKVGQDFYLAFSPERVDPGNKFYNTKNTPKVVGGITPDCTEVAAAMYENILEGNVYRVSSPAVAEMEKIFENIFRNINIGLANEMAILCDKMKIDVWEVIDAAKTKPYGFMAFYPGPGVGGHCIPIDPFYLTWKAREYNYHTRLIETAGEINNYMPEFVLERSMKILNRFGKAMQGAKILLLGVTYKQDIDDVRTSPALDVITCLESQGADLVYHDPFVSKFTYKGKEYTSLELTEQTLNKADLVILTTMHSGFDYEWIARHAKMVFDTKNAFKEVTARANIERL